MICFNTKYISIQDRKKNYSLLPSYHLLVLSIWIKDTGLGYTQIGPTMLVEWSE